MGKSKTAMTTGTPSQTRRCLQAAQNTDPLAEIDEMLMFPKTYRNPLTRVL
jgi:hypothetical protein